MYTATRKDWKNYLKSQEFDKGDKRFARKDLRSYKSKQNQRISRSNPSFTNRKLTFFLFRDISVPSLYHEKLYDDFASSQPIPGYDCEPYHDDWDAEWDDDYQQDGL